MSHAQQRKFVQLIKQGIPQELGTASVLEVGAYDVNGTIRGIIGSENYTGADLVAGPGVDVVCPGEELDFEDHSFDVALSCECFEHNPNWQKTFLNMHRMTKAGGLVVMSCASTGRPEHGTARTSPESSPGSQAIGWDYYRNLSEKDFRRAFDLKKLFSDFFFVYENYSCDLMFVGIVSGGRPRFSLDLGELRRAIIDGMRQIRLEHSARNPMSLFGKIEAGIVKLLRVFPDSVFQNLRIRFLQFTAAFRAIVRKAQLQLLMPLKRGVSRYRKSLRQLLPLGDFAGNLFIVGAQKSGTSALFTYLEKHPRIVCADRKEIHFFDNERSYAKGLHYYRSYFPAMSSRCFSLDATPCYMYWSRCAQRIYDYSPDAKIVMVLREPVSRAFSEFNMLQQIFSDNRFEYVMKNADQDVHDFLLPISNGQTPFEIEYFLDREMEIINSDADAEMPELIRRGIYAPQIERYVKLFGRDNVLILFSNDLKNDPAGIVARVLAFAGLPPLTAQSYPLQHVREYTVDQSVKKKIAASAGELFSRDREKLIRTYGLEVPW